ncbi:hypothetical protein Tco_0108761 [Tanacetum coccineum]
MVKVDLRDFQEEGHPRCSQAKGSKVEERNDAFRRRTETLVNEHKSSGEHGLLTIPLENIRFSMRAANSQIQMNERLDEGMTTLDEYTNNLGKEMINLKNKAVEIEKEIIQAAEAVLTRMDELQNKADDIKNN